MLDEHVPRVYELHGDASLTVEIRNGSQLEVYGTGLTTEQACQVVAAYLPVTSPFEDATTDAS